jgi:Tol biopolymer transport system component
MATKVARPYRSNPWLWALAFGAGVLSLFPLLLHFTDAGSSTPIAAILPAGQRVVYLEFGRAHDTLWAVSPDEPAVPNELLVIDHASDFGAVPSLAPDGRRFAYTLLAPDTKPAPDAPAQLWLADLTGQSRPGLLAGGVDLRVEPVWSRDGGSVAVRRSAYEGDAAEYRLVSIDIETKVERELARSREGALFPVAFAPDGGSFYYVRVRADASDLLARDLASDKQREVARLADGLTRDWTLSPEGERLAYLEMAFAGSRATSRAFVLDIETGLRQPQGRQDVDAFNPAWRADGALALGQAGMAMGVVVSGGEANALPAPQRGFDVPLAWSAAGDGLAVMSFDGNSALAPGRSVLTVVRPDGRRTTISAGEVVFLGWTQ